MIHVNKYKKILFPLVFIAYLFFPKNSFAYSGSCPESMTPVERLACLNEEYGDLNDEASDLESAISSEQQNQKTLQQQIEYVTNLIKQTEIEIDKLEIDIERNNVEILILGDEITKIQGNIDTITQEIIILEESVRDTTKAGYKMTFVSPIELIFGSNNFESVLRKIKYIAQIKERDRDMLTQMSISRTTLEGEESILVEKRAEQQDIRDQTEEERSELVSQKSKLQSQKSNQLSLIAQSRELEEEYTQTLDERYAQINAITAEIAKTITETGGGAKYIGYVPAGYIIGYMGSTGLSTGAHLHFCINDGNPHPIYGYFWGTIDPFTQLKFGPDYYGIIKWWNPSTLKFQNFYEYYVYTSKILSPILVHSGNKPYLTQDWHQGLCVDMSSQAAFSAPIVSAIAGDLTRGVDGYGGKWAKIEHPNGWVTTYLHLQ